MPVNFTAMLNTTDTRVEATATTRTPVPGLFDITVNNQGVTDANHMGTLVFTEREETPGSIATTGPSFTVSVGIEDDPDDGDDYRTDTINLFATNTLNEPASRNSTQIATELAAQLNASDLSDLWDFSATGSVVTATATLAQRYNQDWETGSFVQGTSGTTGLDSNDLVYGFVETGGNMSTNLTLNLTSHPTQYTGDISFELFPNSTSMATITANDITAEIVRIIGTVPEWTITRSNNVITLVDTMERDTEEWNLEVAFVGSNDVTNTNRAVDADFVTVEDPIGRDEVASVASTFVIDFRQLPNIETSLDDRTIVEVISDIQIALSGNNTFRLEPFPAEQRFEISTADSAINSITFTRGTRDVGTSTANALPIPGDIILNSEIRNTSDRERPWRENDFNLSRNFLVTCGVDNSIYANDVDYSFANPRDNSFTNYRSYVERRDISLSEAFGAEEVKSISNIEIMGDFDRIANTDPATGVTTAPTLVVDVNPHPSPGEDRDFPLTTRTDDSYIFVIGTNYKVDIREAGRYLDWRIGDFGDSDLHWRFPSLNVTAQTQGKR